MYHTQKARGSFYIFGPCRAGRSWPKLLRNRIPQSIPLSNSQRQYEGNRDASQIFGNKNFLLNCTDNFPARSKLNLSSPLAATVQEASLVSWLPLCFLPGLGRKVCFKLGLRKARHLRSRRLAVKFFSARQITNYTVPQEFQFSWPGPAVEVTGSLAPFNNAVGLFSSRNT